MTLGSSTISGARFFIHRHSFSIVFNFMYGHSLHEQFASGGAGMNLFPGAAFSI